MGSNGLKIDGRKVLVIIGGADVVHRLPLAPSLVNSPTGGDGSPRFLPLKEVISAPLSACFFLMFYQNCPFPLSSSSIHKLQELTGLPVARLKPGPLHELIVQFALSENHPHGLIASSSSFIVSLPGCPKHSYFLDKGIEKSDTAGAMVKKIPFTHPKCVPDMIEVLRRQAAYNTLISSCVSETTECEDSSDLLHFDVFQQKATSFSVTFQHPLEENLACVMVDVLSSRDVICTLHTHSEDGALICSNDYLTRVLKRCMSIPVLMRAIFKKATQQKAEETSLSKDGVCEENCKDQQVEHNQQ
ncbi:mediator of RNA polymerase II transcription subunit 1-like isoform X1 [Podarcis lilfordi]|uniref:Mediator of RNA polymerase II transcription subunit 1 n=2 Tax=Podarcis lilfordi TaxID=74358 RepID=A0AA35L2S3_9SAUR|nr:mediator of RNA polymerase II transcription subunit 1-like isoform X1 [Podarcis lilfordi]